MPFCSASADAARTGTPDIARKAIRLVAASTTVTAINVQTGSRHTATTAGNGGYTIKVPEGTYRLEIELRSGEKVAKKPEDTHVNNGDLDPGFTRVPGAGHRAQRALPLEHGDPEATNFCGGGKDGGDPGSRLGTMHGEDGS